MDQAEGRLTVSYESVRDRLERLRKARDLLWRRQLQIICDDKFTEFDKLATTPEYSLFKSTLDRLRLATDVLEWTVDNYYFPQGYSVEYSRKRLKALERRISQEGWKIQEAP